MQKSTVALRELAELLANDKAAGGKTPPTVTWYLGNIGRYAEWLERQGLEPSLRHFTLDLVRSYIVELQRQAAHAYHPYVPTQERTLSDHTVNSYARSLRGFSSWLYEEGYTPQPVLARLKAPRCTRKVQPILCAEEIADIVVSLNPRTEIGARDQAIFLLLLDTGMRAGELCSLRLGDLHLDEGYAMVMGKGRKQRPVKVGARAAKAVRFYLMHWRRAAMPHVDHVFVTCRGVSGAGDAFAAEGGEPLTVNTLDLIFRRIGRANGIQRLHPHLLRHTFACMHLLRYRDPFALKSLLGHTTLTMTNHYCEAVQQMDVVRADRVSILDGLDLRALDVNRRGRLPRSTRGS
jgi:site-specific recombinase XerD